METQPGAGLRGLINQSYQKDKNGDGLFLKATEGALVGAIASTVGFLLVELVYLNRTTSQISGKSLAITMLSGAGVFAAGAIALKKMNFDKSAHPILHKMKLGAGVGVIVSAPVLFGASLFTKNDMDARTVMIIASSVVMICAAIAMAMEIVKKKG